MHEQTLQRLRAAAPAVANRLRLLAGESPYFLSLMQDADGNEVAAVLRPKEQMVLPDGSASWQPAVEADGTDLAACQRSLRLAKRKGMRRFIWWELGLGGDIQTSARHLSQWAAGLLESALAMAVRLCAARFGMLPGGCFAVIGLGKLGGMELNLGSDVDLLFIWQAPDDAVTDGRRSLSASEYYQQLSRMLIRLMGERTEDGECWLVDMRLRPGGDGAPICLNLDATLSHYQDYGQTWERAMLLKARPVAGDTALGEAFIAGIQPFVFKRYLDFTTVQALAEMKRRIDVQAKEHVVGPGFDVKRGCGGIREVEFIIQSMQLLRGGRERELCIQSTRQALEALMAAGHLTGADAVKLAEAYWFWRRVEHALQARLGEHTHRLYDGFESYLSRVLDIDDVVGCMHTHAETVHRLFAGQFADMEPATAEAISWLHASPSALRPQMAMFAAADQQRILDALARIATQLKRGLLPERSHAGVDAILSRAMTFWMQDANGVQAVEMFAELLQGIAGRATWVDLLATHEGARHWLVSVLSASRYIAAHVAHDPSWLEWPLEAEQGTMRIQRIRQQMLALDVAHLAIDEALADLGRLVDQGRITAAMAIVDEPPAAPEAVGGWLADVADTAVDRAIAIAVRQLELPADFPLVALAMGKHGSREMGLVSDLDLVFVLVADDPQRPGPRGRNQREWAQRLGRRVIQHLTMQPPFGLGFAFDARLRPSGASGVLVTTLTGFRDYQLHEAQSWEHQALCRARAVAGPDVACRAVMAVVDEVLALPRDLVRLATEVKAMRRKMFEHLGSKRAELINLKQDEGGLVDIEFLAQYARLAFGGQASGMAATLRALPAAAPGAWHQRADFLAQSFVDYRQMENVLRAQLWASVGRLPADDDAPAWETLRRHAPIKSVDALRERMRQVRDAFEALLNTDGEG
jgi:[glutamine synthetase] adenylyltransferase / [glutamine synthetase]-adenylyl-L-tyrosine phosphorylase